MTRRERCQKISSGTLQCKPSNDTNIVSFSLMTYIKLNSTTDACFHVTINLDSKECSTKLQLKNPTS